MMMLVVLASNYLVQFPFSFFGLENILTWGAFTYPIAFLVTDVANRVYGLGFARRVIVIGFIWGVAVSYFFTLNYTSLESSSEEIYLFFLPTIFSKIALRNLIFINLIIV